jgi:hypothetical protein
MAAAAILETRSVRREASSKIIDECVVGCVFSGGKRGGISNFGLRRLGALA